MSISSFSLTPSPSHVSNLQPLDVRCINDDRILTHLANDQSLYFQKSLLLISFPKKLLELNMIGLLQNILIQSVLIFTMFILNVIEI